MEFVPREIQKTENFSLATAITPSEGLLDFEKARREEGVGADSGECGGGFCMTEERDEDSECSDSGFD